MFDHATVLLHPTISLTTNSNTKIAVDCTAGGGGHTQELLRIVGSNGGKVIAFDRDSVAIAHLETRFKDELARNQLILRHTQFSKFQESLTEVATIGSINCIIADLGVSSPQIDIAERGFSFQKNGPLDMRMDTRSQKTAKEILNDYSQDDLTSIFRIYGEEPHAKYYAKKICERRQVRLFESTGDLAEFIKSVTKYSKKSKKHPATKIFQALRIETNEELDEVKKLLEAGFDWLAPGGRFGVITFHSLEDRLVKHYFKQLSEAKDPLPREIPLLASQQNLDRIRGKIIKPFPTLPDDSEITSNPRARSAKLRVIEKIW